MDNLTREQRSFCMSRIRGNDTKPEINARALLKGIEYHPKNFFGKPDFIVCRSKTAVFIDGCFWHKCPIHWNEPKTNKDYWLPKLEKNCVRDKEVEVAYRNAGWKVVRIWEHDIKSGRKFKF